MNEPFDAVLVLGGGLREDGSLPPWVEARLELALEWAGEAPIAVLSAGTVYKPHPLDGNGFPIYEAAAGGRFLLSRGVPAERIFQEASSLDTLGNAYFARCVHAEPAGWRRLLVVTSDFHLPRTEAVFSWAFSLLPYASPYSLAFVSSPDVGIAAEALTARRRKERESLASFLDWRDGVRTLQEFHRFLFTGHSAYRAALQQFRPVGEDLKATY